MPSWQVVEPFIVSGLALGGVYALSGVGTVVLYQATGVVYLAFGAVGAMGALIAWSLTNAGAPDWLAMVGCGARGSPHHRGRPRLARMAGLRAVRRGGDAGLRDGVRPAAGPAGPAGQ